MPYLPAFGHCGNAGITGRLAILAFRDTWLMPLQPSCGYRARGQRSTVPQGRDLPYEPYAPVRQQLLTLLRLVNRLRQSVGREAISPKVLRLRRRIVRPFEVATESTAATTTGIVAASQQSATQLSVSAVNDEFLNWATDYVDKEIA